MLYASLVRKKKNVYNKVRQLHNCPLFFSEQSELNQIKLNFKSCQEYKLHLVHTSYFLFLFEQAKHKFSDAVC